jgi:hemoglobin
VTTLYEHAGTDEALHRLEALFYSKVLADPVLSSLFTERRPHHVDHLTWFTAESFGGPDRFTRELGFQHVIDVHRHLKITDEQRERFVAVYMESLDEAGLPNDEPFRQAVRSHVEFGSRVAQQNSWAETDADLHPIRNVPRWQWPAINHGEPAATGIDADAVLVATEAGKRAFPGAWQVPWSCVEFVIRSGAPSSKPASGGSRSSCGTPPSGSKVAAPEPIASCTHTSITTEPTARPTT